MLYVGTVAIDPTFRYLPETEFLALTRGEQLRYILEAHKRIGAELVLLRSLVETLAPDDTRNH